MFSVGLRRRSSCGIGEIAASEAPQDGESSEEDRAVEEDEENNMMLNTFDPLRKDLALRLEYFDLYVEYSTHLQDHIGNVKKDKTGKPIQRTERAGEKKKALKNDDEEEELGELMQPRISARSSFVQDCIRRGVAPLPILPK